MPGELDIRPLINRLQVDLREAGEAAWERPAARALLALDRSVKATALTVASFKRVGPLVARLAKGKVAFSSIHVWWILDKLVARGLEVACELDVDLLVKALKSVVTQGALDDALIARTRAVANGIWVRQRHGDGPRFLARIERVVGDGAPDPLRRALGTEPWGATVGAFLDALPGGAQEAWWVLLRHAASVKAKPTAPWITKAITLVAKVDTAVFAERVVVWADAAPVGRNPTTVDSMTPTGTPIGLREENADLLRGLLFTWAVLGEERAGATLGRLAHTWLKKIPGIGSGARKLGNAALTALGLLPGLEGVPHLSRLSGRLRTAEARSALEAALVDAAERAGLARADVEEVAIGDRGVSVDEGTVVRGVGPATAAITVDGARAVVSWTTAAGRPSRGVPKEARDADAEGVSDVVAQAKEIQHGLDGVRDRLERAWIENRSWSYATWRERWLDHGLVGQIARRQIWVVEGKPVLWFEGALRTADGAAIPEPAGHAVVSLWHPADAVGAGEVLAWRDRLEALGVVQPVRQAWRELYVVTPAELETSTHSNRFAGHLLRQHAFHAIAQRRGWRYHLQGPWHAQVTPERVIVHGDTPWRVTFRVGADGGSAAAEDPVVFRWVATDQVRFYRNDGNVAVAEVPPRLFSELMRDVDLFVAVCSVGLDPNWRPGLDAEGDAAWWRTAFVDDLAGAASVRRDVLARLLPRLKIGGCTRLEGPWLHVTGQRGSYRIHLGSGAATTAAGRYLCIVVDRNQREPDVKLPYTGDLLLAVILSKAFLLASDALIADPSILRQLDEGR